MGILSNIYLLDKSQFVEMILNGSFQSKGETISFDHLGMYYITGPISTELIDDGVGAGKIFPTEAQKLLWDSIPPISADWDEQDSTAADYIKNKPTIPQSFTYNVDDVELNGASIVDSSDKKAKIPLYNYLTHNELLTINNNSLIDDSSTPADVTIHDIYYLDEEPEENYTSGYLAFVLLNEAPTEEYEGYLYFYPDSEV